MAAARPLRGAILGVGHVAIQGHVPVWARRADVLIRAAADPRPAARERLARDIPGVVWYESAERLLEREEVDFVDICTPPSTHAPLIRAALERGAHVLCEKPLVLDPGELALLSSLAARRRAALSTVDNWRYAPLLARASELVREGTLGEVRRCEWEVWRNRPAVALPAGRSAENWRLDPAISGGGILVDHGWHAAYLLHEWLARPIRRVRATLENRRQAEWRVEDTADVSIEFDGAEAHLFLTWAGEDRRNRIVVEGTRGTLRIEGRRLEISRASGETEAVEYPQALSEGSHHPDWFGGVAAEFVSAIDDPTRRAASLAEAEFCLGMIRLAYESARRGEPVDSPRPSPIQSAAAGGEAGAAG